MATWSDQALFHMSETLGMIDPRRRLVVLTLHRVEGSSQIKLEHVRQHFEYLAKNYKTILPSQLAVEEAAHYRRHLAMVVIDDCHHDTYQHIFPVAKTYKIPITIATPTNFFLRNQWLWFDKLYWVLACQEGPRRLQIAGYNLDREHAPSVSGFKEILKASLPPVRDELLEEMSRKMGCPFPEHPTDEFRAVSTDEMKEMLATGLAEISAHSVSHPIVSLLSDKDLEYEIMQSRQELEDFSGGRIASFCYPNGKAGDFDERTTMAVQRAGYQMAFTTVPGRNILKGFDKFAIKRVHIRPRLSIFAKDTGMIGEIRGSIGT